MDLIRNATADSEADLEEGMRVYNEGDIKNESHFGTIVELYSDEWGKHAVIEPDDDCTQRDEPYEVTQSLIDPVYEGHSGTRIVPEIEKYKYDIRSIIKLRATKMNDFDVSDVNDEQVYELAKRLRDNEEVTTDDLNEVVFG